MTNTGILNIHQLATVWTTDPDAVKIWDLRTATEFAACHIPGATRIDDLHEIAQSVWAQRDVLHVLIPQVGQSALECADDIERHRAQDMKLAEIDCAVLNGSHDEWCAGGRTLFRNGMIETRGVKMTENLIFHQLFEHESSTYTYLLADPRTREAVLIDPVLETVDRDLKLIEELGLDLVLVLDTHVHADHVTGAGAIRKRLGGRVKTAVSARAKVSCVDIPLEDGQQLRFGDSVITAIATPGHTDACTSFYLPTRSGGMVFTGDALLIRGTGRTDFQQGSADALYDSVTKKLFTLPESTSVYPGHDYRGFTVSTIAAEKKLNPRVGGGRSKDEFKKIMSELKLAHPKKIAESLPANLNCGVKTDQRLFHPQKVNGISEITPEDLRSAMASERWQPGTVKLIDVRRPEEYVGEYGHVIGAELVTLGPDLERFLIDGNRDEEIVFICRSGGRSGHATGVATEMGYKAVINMQGGMIRWTELKYPVEK
ncbi:MAG: MBL fold metallo-hydrolase [Bdellovibrionaceae bacterium]|nr:MBL fold metallo-hydrolase [Pseudobdellovibrionaceae bacterium]